MAGEAQLDLRNTKHTPQIVVTGQLSGPQDLVWGLLNKGKLLHDYTLSVSTVAAGLGASRFLLILQCV